MKKSVENVLISNHQVMSSINSLSMANQSSSNNLANGSHSDSVQDGGDNERPNSTSSQNLSSKASSQVCLKKDHKSHKDDKDHKDHSSKGNSDNQKDTYNLCKLNGQQTQEITRRSSDSAEVSKHSASDGKKETKSERSKKKSWYSNILYPTYKSRSDNFKKIFKDVPNEERLVVDYSCALQREILVHGRLYVSQNYVCFYANIFMWETLVSLRWKDVTSMTKEKTALVIPNAILLTTATDKFFLTSFGSRDKTFMMLFKIWQNALLGQLGKSERKRKCKSKKCNVESMSMTEMWQLVHDCYGDELGLTSDDEDYAHTSAIREEKLSKHLSLESFSEGDIKAEIPATCDVLTEAPLIPVSPLHSAVVARPEGSNEPTDLSYSSESEAEKESLDEIGLKSTAVCTGSHDGRPVIKATLPVQIDKLFTLLFTNSKFFLDFHTARKTTDLIQPAWTEDSTTGQKMRKVSLTVSLNQGIGPKSSQVTEMQVMLPCSTPGHIYCLDVETTNSGIPYADSFSILSHYCLTSVSENESFFSVFSEIKYKKNVWGLVKSFIEKNCWSSMEEYFNSLIKALAVECEENGTGAENVKRKTRRRRRIPAPGITVQTHSPDHTALNHQSPVVELPHRNNVNAIDLRGESSAMITWILLIAVLGLMIINGLLYYKLWGLEEAAPYTIMDLHVLKNTPKSQEDWINLLQQQESLHNIEIKKWQRVLSTAAQLLRQTEESLTQLQMSIHPTTTEKMFSVLKPGLKTHNSQNEQQGDQDL